MKIEYLQPDKFVYVCFHHRKVQVNNYVIKKKGCYDCQYSVELTKKQLTGLLKVDKVLEEMLN